jgi:hypothetical protein
MRASFATFCWSAYTSACNLAITASLEAGCSEFPASGCGVRQGGGIEAQEKDRDGSGATTPSNTGKRISIYGTKEIGRYLPSLRGFDGPAA